MAGTHCAFASRNFFLRPEDIFALCDGSIRVNAAENCATTANLAVVDDNKASQIRNPVVIIYDEWRARLNCNSANLVSLQLFASVAGCLECGRICYLFD